MVNVPVEIFVGTPDGKVNAPLIEMKGHIAHCMSQVPANLSTFIFWSLDPWQTFAPAAWPSLVMTSISNFCPV